MAIPHAKPAEPVDVRPLGSRLAASQTTTLIKTGAVEVIRLVLPAGKEIAPHKARGEVTIHCLEGRVALEASANCELTPGTLVYLTGGEQHAVRAIEDSSLLVTILLTPKAAP